METTLLPFFPLNLFVLPGEEMSLHIFEPRYKQLVGDVQELNVSFGVPYVKGKKMTEWGCEVKLKKITQLYPNGAMDVIIEGIGVFRVQSFMDKMDGKLYSGGHVNLLHLRNKRASQNLLDLFQEVQNKVLGQSSMYSYDSSFTINQIAQNSPLTNEQKVKYISSPNDLQRELYLMNQLKLLILLKKQEECLEYNFYLN